MQDSCKWGTKLEEDIIFNDLLSFSLLFHIYYILFGEGNGNLLQYSHLENPMGGGAW